MVFGVDSDHVSSTSVLTPIPALATASSSLASVEDLEGGDSSQDDNVGNERHDVAMVSKFVPMISGRMPRRLSQCDQLFFRKRKQRPAGESPESVTQPAAFRRWSTLASSNGDLPKTIQFSLSDQNSSPRQQRRSPLLVIASVALLALTGTVFVQQSQISALNEELKITNQHRRYLEKSQGNLVSQLEARESLLNQYRHTHAQMTKVNRDMSSRMTKLRREC
mmetsp:Transcript_24721/g.59596  ORF Transcript_24721/g.59596 Transcript_24721/m.59596 type:complete len:222 (-) Transcript_24721:125-790(-)|eukprot:CAMPEP_0181089470 /NCGR_PEP_ID=MMETSP1071-20121207/7322_1 /TAXON_ID=35127 /ORGANISM="Thalassiosira sp., Strain NH16" /LENGTH=221 /DNA_ID=CAMNT_0023171425 /DNA_START=142 /DNA_END=807 /DNA_ORIENTATION=+